MSRYERRLFFERLCELRAANAAAGEADRLPVWTIDEVIEWASAIMAAYAAETLATPPAAPAAAPRDRGPGRPKSTGKWR